MRSSDRRHAVTEQKDSVALAVEMAEAALHTELGSTCSQIIYCLELAAVALHIELERTCSQSIHCLINRASGSHKHMPYHLQTGHKEAEKILPNS